MHSLRIGATVIEEMPRGIARRSETEVYFVRDIFYGLRIPLCPN